MKVTGLNPTIQVHDLKIATDFYTSLGFISEWLWPDDHPTHGSVSSNGFAFMFVKIDEKVKLEIADLYFRVEKVEQLHKELNDKGIQTSALVKTEYGMLDFSITDPFGHHLVFGEPSGDYQG